MIFVYTKNIITFFKIIIFWNILNNKNGVHSVTVNTSELIKTIFSDQPHEILKDLHKSGNYAEGGLVHDHSTKNSSLLTGKSTFFSNFTSSLEHLNRQTTISEESITHNDSSRIKGNTLEKQEHNIINSETIPVKLNDTGTNLFLGMPEVMHINGISSIKPRKGVQFPKIVPRKGVGNGSRENYTLISENNCMLISDSKCHSVTSKDGTMCFCCKSEITYSQVLDCGQCQFVNSSWADSNKCQGVCCKNMNSINMTDTYIVQSESENEIHSQGRSKKIFKKILPQLNATTLKALGEIESSSSGLGMKNISNNSMSKVKFKPDITKVPYDVDIVTDLLGDSPKEILVPVIAFILLVPMFGICIYFIWRRTKDYWEKRYYKRMDFLIDGMYND